REEARQQPRRIGVGDRILPADELHHVEPFVDGLIRIEVEDALHPVHDGMKGAPLEEWGAAALDARVSVVSKLLPKEMHQVRLPDAGLAAQDHDAGRALLDGCPAFADDLELRLASDGAHAPWHTGQI